MMKVIEKYDQAMLSAKGYLEISQIEKNKSKVYQILIEKREGSCDFEKEETSVYFTE
jgi:hypothetical protein